MVKGFDFLHAVLTETLRLYPSVPSDPKYVVNDDVLPSGHKVALSWSLAFSSEPSLQSWSLASSLDPVRCWLGSRSHTTPSAWAGIASHDAPAPNLDSGPTGDSICI